MNIMLCISSICNCTWRMNMLQEVAWLPCWLQSLGTNGSIEFLKESQAPSYKEAKVRIPLSEIMLLIFFCGFNCYYIQVLFIDVQYLQITNEYHKIHLSTIQPVVSFKPIEDQIIENKKFITSSI